MSFNIPNIGTVGVSALSRAERVPTQTGSAAAAAAIGADAPVKIDTLPLSPPPEVHAAMSLAADSYHKLAAQGRELSFHVDDRTGKVSVEVHDLDGNLLFTAPPSKALDIASGGSLD